ncbi:MAG: serine hydrolase [Candidatus Levybacteria bacterium]|nr:serine hydrolase [Candidatus Levybacteria bacterium]
MTQFVRTLALFLCLLFAVWVGVSSFRALFLSAALSDVVKSSMQGAKGKYAIVIKNLKTNETYMQNERDWFQSASLYKLWVMAAVFEQMKEGSIEKNEVLHEDIAKLNEAFEIASEEAELKEGDITLTISNALDQMITISHNYAALLLSKQVGNNNVAKVLSTYGLKKSDYASPPKTTALDTALFFEKLYKGKIVDKVSSDAMLDLLKKQQINDRIPKYLPKDVQVAHKTGEIGWFKHDAGIVFKPKGDYIFVVLSESDSPPGAAERIAKLSQAVYGYFVTKQSFLGF